MFPSWYFEARRSMGASIAFSQGFACKMCVMQRAGPFRLHLLDFTIQIWVPLQILRCFCLNCDHHDLDRHLSAWQSGYCWSQSVSDTAQVPWRGMSVVYVCNHGPVRGMRCCVSLPYFQNPCVPLASTYQKLMLFGSNALLSFLVSTSPRLWCLGIPLDWFHIY